MKYEVLKRYENNGHHNPFNFADGTPMKIRIFPEDASPKQMLTALVMAAYGRGGWSTTMGLGGLAAIGSPDELSIQEAQRYLGYSTPDQRGPLQHLRRVPDNRTPNGVHAGFINGRAVRLSVYASDENPGAFDMNTHTYIADVGPIDELMDMAQQLIPFVQREPNKKFSLRQFLGRR